MSNSIMNFKFEGAEVRVASDENGNPWFVGKDVCELLGYKDPTNAMKRHCKGVAKRHPLYTDGGKQEARVISESDVMRLICNSKLPAAVQFEKWVFEEVLPSIRKSGGYIAAKADETPEMIMARAIKLADETINRQKLQLEEKDKKIAEASKQIEMDKPKVVFAESIAVAKTSILVGEMAKLIKQSTGVEIGQNRFFDYLRDKGYLHSKGSQKNLPTQRSVNAGWFEVKEGTRINSEGVSVITRTPKITGKGQIYFVNLFAKESNSLPLM